MSFQDPPRRQRPPRYPALAQYEDGPQDSYQGFAGLTGTPRQRPPWDDPQERSAWDSGAQQAVPDSSGPGSGWGSGSQQAARDTGAHRLSRNTGAQETSWDLAGPQTGLPRRASGSSGSSGAFGALTEDGRGRPPIGRHGDRRIRPPRSRGLLPGAAAGFLAASVALGVANLVAAFVRPQASPIIAVGGAFIDRTPSALKNFAVAKFGENDKNMLLLGMYVTIALIAVAIGVLAWRRLWIGVAGIGLFGLFGAFVAITRPDSHVTDVIPSIVGGIAGIAAIVLLIRAGLPRTRAALARGR